MNQIANAQSHGSYVIDEEADVGHLRGPPNQYSSPYDKKAVRESLKGNSIGGRPKSQGKQEPQNPTN